MKGTVGVTYDYRKRRDRKRAGRIAVFFSKTNMKRIYEIEFYSKNKMERGKNHAQTVVLRADRRCGRNPDMKSK